MTGQTHLGVGLLVGVLAPALGFAGPDGPISWAALAVGSLAPDLDGGGLVTKPSAWLPSMVPVPPIVDRTGRAAGRLVSRTLGHRGLLHYPVVVVLMGVLAASLSSPGLAWLTVGYASHLLVDSLTKGGIPLFGPLSKRRMGLLPRALRVKTGGGVEATILAVVWLSFVGLAVATILEVPFLARLRPRTNSIFLPFVSKN
jgi:inner membrane protein